MASVNDEQAAYWSEVAPDWVENADRLERIAGRPGMLAMDRLGPRAGQRVLDIGCGAGTTTRELARRVGPEGSVVGVDIAEEMIRAARLEAPENVEFRLGDVQEAELGPPAFDAAYSRFGVMFFADPVRAFANVRSALSPGGAVSFVVWRGLADNEWMLVPGMAAVEVTGEIPPLPELDQPGPFSLSAPEKVSRILVEAGFSDVDVLGHDDHVTFDEGQIGRMADSSMKVGAIRALLAESTDDVRSKVREAIQGALRARLHDGRVELTRGVLLVRARS